MHPIWVMMFTKAIQDCENCIESFQDQPIQQLVESSPPGGEWVESSRDQLVQQWARR